MKKFPAGKFASLFLAGSVITTSIAAPQAQPAFRVEKIREMDAAINGKGGTEITQ